jgi:formylmethanofuran dehydrogenase subunit E
MKSNMDPVHTVSPELTSLLEKAAEFHGHLGPFLAIGVRIGLIGLRKIGNHNGDQLTIDLSLPLHVPFSCIIDGLQVTTHCTVGNQKLSLEDSDSIQARFKRENDSMEVVVALNRSVLEEMKSELLGDAIPEEEIRRLAWVIASISEEELLETSPLPSRRDETTPP